MSQGTPMQQCQLPPAFWQVVMKALLNVHAPMAETGPVYNALAQQLSAAGTPSNPVDATDRS